jgi:hypothetical protein
MRLTRVLAGAGLALVLAAPLAAQGSGMPESYRQVQLNALELQRTMLLAMVDSMPERLLRDKATPAQRDFAQQIEHASGAVVFLVMTAVKPAGVTRPTTADTATHLNTKAGLKAFINTIYDWAGNILKTQSAADRAAMTTLFGKPMPVWQVWDEVHQHTIWTAGQVVANFRKNGMAPPGFGFF